MSKKVEEDTIIIEQNLQWATRIQRKMVTLRKFCKIHTTIQGGVVTGVTVEQTLKPGDDVEIF